MVGSGGRPVRLIPDNPPLAPLAEEEALTLPDELDSDSHALSAAGTAASVAIRARNDRRDGLARPWIRVVYFVPAEPRRRRETG